MWKGGNNTSTNGDDDDDEDTTTTTTTAVSKASTLTTPWRSMDASRQNGQRKRQSRHLPSPWSCSLLIAFTTILALVFLLSIVYSFAARSSGSNGCGVPMMSPTFIRMLGFDTEHTRFASKYNLFLYREEGVDQYNQENLGVRGLLLTMDIFPRG